MSRPLRAPKIGEAPPCEPQLMPRKWGSDQAERIVIGSGDGHSAVRA